MGSIPGRSALLYGNNFGQVVCINVALLQSVIIWFGQRMVTPCDGKVTVSLASRWPYVIEFSDLRTHTHGLRKEMNTPPICSSWSTAHFTF